jgi:hypothetical protein
MELYRIVYITKEKTTPLHARRRVWWKKIYDFEFKYQKILF